MKTEKKRYYGQECTLKPPIITIYFYCCKGRFNYFKFPTDPVNYSGKILIECNAIFAIKIKKEIIFNRRNVKNEVKTFGCRSCVTWHELNRYARSGKRLKDVYAIPLYDVKFCPLELSDFTSDMEGKNTLISAPQSWRKAYFEGKECYIFSDRSQYLDLILRGEKRIELRKTLPKEIHIDNMLSNSGKEIEK
jgi:hypothetical protein